MANIITRTFSDGPNKAIQLGTMGASGSFDSGMYRTLSYGTNWKYIRMGILCAVVDSPSSSYNREFGFAMGISSGSKTLNAYPSGSSTCIGLGHGKFTNPLGGISPEGRAIYASDAISGSFFYTDTTYWGGQTNGVNDSGTQGSSTNAPCIANLADVNKRRSIVIFEASQSSNTAYTIAFYSISSAAMTAAKNIDFTSANLLAAMTGSTTNLSASFVGLNRSTANDITHATNSLDTAFVEYAGGIPFEVYDWYIYKLG